MNTLELKVETFPIVWKKPFKRDNITFNLGFFLTNFLKKVLVTLRKLRFYGVKPLY